MAVYGICHHFSVLECNIFSEHDVMNSKDIIANFKDNLVVLVVTDRCNGAAVEQPQSLAEVLCLNN